MKRALSLVLIALPVLPFIACSSSENPIEVPNTGGTAATPMAGTGTTGGSSSSAGTAAQTGGMSGSTATAGTSSDAGTSSTAGTGTGGAAAGTSAGGMSGTGTGGSAGSGTGGSAGGTGGTAAAVSVGELDGMLVQTPCKSTNSDDCVSGGWIYKGVTHGCTGSSLNTDADATKTILDFPVTGEKGKIYLATMHFYGIMEPKQYGDNIQREATTRPGEGSPSTPAPFAWGKTPGATYTPSDYNTYELHVIDDKGMAVKDYYLNADTMQGHYTFVIDYERTIEIVGGGKIHVKSYDNNCRMIKNCGPAGHDQSACATNARSVAGVSAAMPAITVMQPGLGQAADQSGQWFAIDVKTIVPKP
jgi:hypothetical protein